MVSGIFGMRGLKLMDTAIDASFWEVGWSTYQIARDDVERVDQKRYFRSEAAARDYVFQLERAMTFMAITNPQAKLYICEHKFQG